MPYFGFDEGDFLFSLFFLSVNDSICWLQNKSLGDKTTAFDAVYFYLEIMFEVNMIFLAIGVATIEFRWKVSVKYITPTPFPP